MEITKQKLPDLYFLIDYDAYSEQYESLYAIFVSEEEAIKTAKSLGATLEDMNMLVVKKMIYLILFQAIGKERKSLNLERAVLL